MVENNDAKPAVRHVKVPDSRDGQRLDNFLSLHLKGAPRSHIYRIIRTGQVRVNGGRAKPATRLEANDTVRIPPLRLPTAATVRISDKARGLLRQALLYQDDQLLVINKPAGLAVHRGTGVDVGAIDILRSLYPDQKELELVHRLDRETSGCLLVAKTRPELLRLQKLMQGDDVAKAYLCLGMGRFEQAVINVNAPLRRNAVRGGERVVTVSDDGKPADTQFRLVHQYRNACFLEAELGTGRTHQIRVHAGHIGHPLAGDSKYGDREFNRRLAQKGLQRLFLHAHKLVVPMANGGEEVFNAPLPDDLNDVLNGL